MFSELGLRSPVVAAPMAGGPTTPELVLAAATAGCLGFLAAGYRSADDLAAQIDTVTAQTATYGVNLFAPNPVPVDGAAYDAYRSQLAADAERFGVTLPAEPREDDDGWRDKIDVLVDKAPPIVSFTFGIPDPAALTALRRTGCLLVQTVTSAAEALQARDAGFGFLAVQAAAAGGHYGTLTPGLPSAGTRLPDLVAEIRHAVDVPVIAAGGVAGSPDVKAALTAGASAVAVGTLLLLAPESGSSPAHRRALTEPTPRETVVTRAFTGRPARGLRNTFIDNYDALAPAGYPALHYLTSPLRKASAAATDPEFVNVFAGTGYRAATEQPAADILRRLAVGL
jgi:nitronate monooxygenase